MIRKSTTTRIYAVKAERIVTTKGDFKDALSKAIFKINDAPLYITKRYTYLCLLILCSFGYNSMATATLISMYGRGNFLYPFIVTMLLYGLPALHLEIFLGQYTKRSLLKAWKCAPISYGVFILLGVVAVYNAICASMLAVTAMYFLTESFKKNLPWMRCDYDYNDGTICFDRALHVLSPLCYTNGSTFIYCPDGSIYELPPAKFMRYSYYGGPYEDLYSHAKILIVLFVYWCIILILLFTSIHKYTKFIVAVLVYLICHISLMLLVTSMKPGSMAGLSNLFVYEFEHINEVNVFTDGMCNSLRILSIGTYTNFAYSSKLTFKSSASYDAIVVVFASIGICMLLALSQYGVVGVLAHDLTADINTLVHGYTHYMLVLVPYYYGSSPFLLVSTFAGIALVITVTEGIITSGGMDSILDFFNLYKKKTIIYIAYAMSSYVLAALLTLKIGFGAVHHGSVEEILLITGWLTGVFFEMLTFSVLYGTRRLCEDIEFKNKTKPTSFWKISWYLLPLATAFLYFQQIMHVATVIKTGFENIFDLVFLIALFLHLLIIPFFAVQTAIKYFRWRELGDLTRPRFDWGPPNRILRQARKRFHPTTQIRSQAVPGHNITPKTVQDATSTSQLL